MSELGINEEVVTVSLAGKEYPIDFTMASIYYLSEKYGDVAALFSKMGNGVDTKSLDIICDLIYASIIKCDDDDKFVAPLSQKKIMANLHFNEIAKITVSITQAFANSFPDAQKNPTQGAKAPAKAKDGTGDTSTRQESLI